jgi:hypothetical protein
MKIPFLMATVFALLLARCGENTSTPQENMGLGAPQNLKALSVNDATVRLSWSPPAGLTPSMISTYVIAWANRIDSVQMPALQYDAVVVPAGETAFTVLARLTTNQRPSAAEIRWAPAARYDSPITIYEYDVAQQNRPCGIDAGSQTTSPRSLSVFDPGASLGMDMYLIGQAGQSLTLRSAHLLVASWSVSAFSSLSHASTSLDYPLSAFPDASTFSGNAVQVEDNTIYYVRIQGDTGTLLFARVHVHVLAGSFPNRAIEIRISLQKKPGVLYADELLLSPCRPLL